MSRILYTSDSGPDISPRTPYGHQCSSAYIFWRFALCHSAPLQIKRSLIFQPPPIVPNTPDLLSIVVWHWIRNGGRTWVNSVLFDSPIEFLFFLYSQLTCLSSILEHRKGTHGSNLLSKLSMPRIEHGIAHEWAYEPSHHSKCQCRQTKDEYGIESVDLSTESLNVL